jgi:hypothetical protein
MADQRDRPQGQQTSDRGTVRQFPPRMSRSQPQLATAYAPGSMFTWEGGKGACISVPTGDGTAIDFSGQQTRRDQIVDTLVEFCQTWLTRGLSIERQGAPAPIYETQLLDTCFHNPMHRGLSSIDIALDRFEFLRPERMGYIPGPLVYRCDICEVVREYVSPAHQVAEQLPAECTAKGETHNSVWRQLDVVYVHWSGGLEGLSPYRYTTDRDGAVRKIPRCKCGTEEFRLFKQGNQFSRWRFKCTGCSSEREVYQTDPFTLNLLKPRMDQQVAHQWSEINMIPVSYRASPVFYVQTARFIVFDNDPEVVTLMSPARTEDLTSRVAALHGFGGVEPSFERIREQLTNAGTPQLFVPYAMMRAEEEKARASGKITEAEQYAKFAQEMLNSWYAAKTVVRDAQPSPALQEQISERGGYARRYDPIRSTIEHDALRRRKLEPVGEAADLRKTHADLCPEHGYADLELVYQQRVGKDLGRAGIADARLIRNLDMVEFSFGFTRVSATPETTQKDRRMPVRLMGFLSLQNGKRPIYVIEQQNEAIYVRLDPDTVARFLIANGLLTQLPAVPKTIGGVLIETYQDFERFLQDFSVRDAEARVRTRDVASMMFLLLHTMSHQVMHGVARFSGLDLGSLSEVIFPADLAFLVHRRGMTEDLGNISSMWRDQNSAFLRYLVSRRELRCGSGTLCDHRGGACPACIMIPETSCVANNQLLSRAALVGGRAPSWDRDQRNLVGYFEIVAQSGGAGAAGGD